MHFCLEEVLEIDAFNTFKMTSTRTENSLWVMYVENGKVRSKSQVQVTEYCS